jgi:hypothetical protein
MLGCSANNCIKNFIKDELKKNENDIKILVDRKLSSDNSLKIYRGVKRDAYNTQAKSFNQKDLDFLIKVLKKDSLSINLWNVEDEKKYILIKRTMKKGLPYDKNEYNNLLIKNKKSFDYWKRKESSAFNFDYLIKYDDVYHFRDSINKINSNRVITTYYFSKPMFYNNKESAMFSIYKTVGKNLDNEDFLVIMKKEKGQWILLEKVVNSALHK